MPNTRTSHVAVWGTVTTTVLPKVLPGQSWSLFEHLRIYLHVCEQIFLITNLIENKLKSQLSDVSFDTRLKSTITNYYSDLKKLV